MTQHTGPRTASEPTNYYARVESRRKDLSLRASSRFFVRIGQVGKASEPKRCPFTAELFGIAEYLRCDGLLAADAGRLA